MGFCLLKSMIISLFLTILLEEIFAAAVGIRRKKDLLLVCLVNLLTNPSIVLIYYMVKDHTALNLSLVLLSLEILAVLIEAHYFKAYALTIRHPFLFSLCANSFSFSVGKIITILF